MAEVHGVAAAEQADGFEPVAGRKAFVLDRDTDYRRAGGRVGGRVDRETVRRIFRTVASAFAVFCVAVHDRSDAVGRDADIRKSDIRGAQLIAYISEAVVGSKVDLDRLEPCFFKNVYSVALYFMMNESDVRDISSVISDDLAGVLAGIFPREEDVKRRSRCPADHDIVDVDGGGAGDKLERLISFRSLILNARHEGLFSGYDLDRFARLRSFAVIQRQPPVVNSLVSGQLRVSGGQILVVKRQAHRAVIIVERVFVRVARDRFVAHLICAGRFHARVKDHVGNFVVVDRVRLIEHSGPLKDGIDQHDDTHDDGDDVQHLHSAQERAQNVVGEERRQFRNEIGTGLGDVAHAYAPQRGADKRADHHSQTTDTERTDVDGYKSLVEVAVRLFLGFVLGSLQIEAGGGSLFGGVGLHDLLVVKRRVKPFPDVQSAVGITAVLQLVHRIFDSLFALREIIVRLKQPFDKSAEAAE